MLKGRGAEPQDGSRQVAQQAAWDGSMSESLAHGLASRFTSGVRASTIAGAARQAQVKSVKRAAAYRMTRDDLLSSIPARLRMRAFEKDKTGKDKSGFYLLYYWDTSDAFTRQGEIQEGTEGELLLISTMLRARDGGVSALPVCSVSKHALMRLFYRLRTTDEKVVLNELQDLSSALWEHISAVRQTSIEAELLIPTRSGAFVVALDARRPGECIAKTWMSDERMKDNVRRLHAVFVARAEQGFVVNHVGGFPVVSQQRLESFGARTPRDPKPKDLNALCDSLCPENGKLPWSWRFREWSEALTQQIESAGYDRKSLG